MPPITNHRMRVAKIQAAAKRAVSLRRFQYSQEVQAKAGRVRAQTVGVTAERYWGFQKKGMT